MSDKYPGFFTAIFGSKKKDEHKEKTVEKKVRKERLFPDSDKRVYYPAKSKGKPVRSKKKFDKEE